MITFHVLTLFPESFPSILNVGLIGKAFQKKLFEVNTINIKLVSFDKKSPLVTINDITDRTQVEGYVN